MDYNTTNPESNNTPNPNNDLSKISARDYNRIKISQWRQKNPEKYKKQQREYQKVYLSNPDNRAIQRNSNNLRLLLKTDYETKKKCLIKGLAKCSKYNHQ